jgi:hypothetical protein
VFLPAGAPTHTAIQFWGVRSLRQRRVWDQELLGLLHGHLPGPRRPSPDLDYPKNTPGRLRARVDQSGRWGTWWGKFHLFEIG